MNKIAFARSHSSVGLGLAPAVYSAKANRCGGSEPPPYERFSVQPLYLRQTTAEDKTVFERRPSVQPLCWIILSEEANMIIIETAPVKGGFALLYLYPYVAKWITVNTII